MTNGPVLDRDTAVALALRGDETVALAFAQGIVGGLDIVFRGPLLLQLEAQVKTMAARGIRLEENVVLRRLAEWDATAVAVTLAVQALARMVTPDVPAPQWVVVQRQVRYGLALAGGRWWIVERLELTPDLWTRVRP